MLVAGFGADTSRDFQADPQGEDMGSPKDDAQDKKVILLFFFFRLKNIFPAGYCVLGGEQFCAPVQGGVVRCAVQYIHGWMFSRAGGCPLAIP